MQADIRQIFPKIATLQRRSDTEATHIQQAHIFLLSRAAQRVHVQVQGSAHAAELLEKLPQHADHERAPARRLHAAEVSRHLSASIDHLA